MKLLTLALLATGLAAAVYKKGMQREQVLQPARSGDQGRDRADRSLANTTTNPSTHTAAAKMPIDDGSTEGGSWARRAARWPATDVTLELHR